MSWDKWVLPIAEIVGGFYTDNYGMMADGAKKGYAASKSGKDDNGGSMKGQAKDIKDNPISTGSMLYGSYSGGEDGGGAPTGLGLDYLSLFNTSEDASSGVDTGSYRLPDGSLNPDYGGGDMTGDNSVGGMDAGSILSAGTAILGGLGNMFGKNKRQKKVDEAYDKWYQQDQDTQMRREATYRQDRALLMDALKQYYGKTGMKFPDLTNQTYPVTGTTRSIPGDFDYPNQNKNLSAEEYYGKPLVFSQDAPTDGSVHDMSEQEKTPIQKAQDATSGSPEPAVKTKNAQLSAADKWNLLFGRM